MLGAPSFSPNGQRIAYLRTRADSPIMAAANLDFARQSAGRRRSTPAAHARELSGRADLVARRAMDRLRRMEGQALGAGQGARRERGGADRACARTAFRTRRRSGPRRATGLRGRPKKGSCWSRRTAARSGSSISTSGSSTRGRATGRRSWGSLRPKICGCRWSASMCRTERRRVLGDLGPSPPANNPVQGFSVSADGRRILIVVRADAWRSVAVSKACARSRALATAVPVRLRQDEPRQGVP